MEILIGVFIGLVLAIVIEICMFYLLVVYSKKKRR